MSDEIIVGFSIFGPIIGLAIFYFLCFPRPTEYEWKKHMAAKDAWIKMMEGKK